MRIMYVEDNDANLALVRRVAKMGGHDIVHYTEGEKVLENFDKDKPDIVLMDVQLAGEISGLEVVRTLRDRGVDTTIVAVTAYAMVGDRERCIEAGCNMYMPKPLPVPDLVQLFKQQVERMARQTNEMKKAAEDAKLKAQQENK